MSLRFDFHQAAHAARKVMVKHQQRLITLEKEWEAIYDKFDNVEKHSPEWDSLKNERIQKSIELANCERDVRFWEEAWREAVALY